MLEVDPGRPLFSWLKAANHFRDMVPPSGGGKVRRAYLTLRLVSMQLLTAGCIGGEG